MRRVPSPIVVPLAAAMLLSASMLAGPTPEVVAQTPKPKPAATAKPAGSPTAPRAGGIPLELAGALVAGGSVLAGGGLYALRRRKRDS